MNIIRLATWYIIGITVIILEFILRLYLTPFGIMFIVLLTAFGCKSAFGEDMKPFWEYMLIWHLKDQFLFSKNVIDYLNPKIYLN